MITKGTTGDGFKFHERIDNNGAKETRRLIQINRHGEWHGYINAGWKRAFINEEMALEWLKSQES